MSTNQFIYFLVLSSEIPKSFSISTSRANSQIILFIDTNKNVRNTILIRQKAEQSCRNHARRDNGRQWLLFNFVNHKLRSAIIKSKTSAAHLPHAHKSTQISVGHTILVVQRIESAAIVSCRSAWCDHEI